MPAETDVPEDVQEIIDALEHDIAEINAESSFEFGLQVPQHPYTERCLTIKTSAENEPNRSASRVLLYHLRQLRIVHTPLKGYVFSDMQQFRDHNRIRSTSSTNFGGRICAITAKAITAARFNAWYKDQAQATTDRHKVLAILRFVVETSEKLNDFFSDHDIKVAWHAWPDWLPRGR